MLIKKNIIRKPEKTEENKDNLPVTNPEAIEVSGFYYVLGKFINSSLTRLEIKCYAHEVCYK